MLGSSGARNNYTSMMPANNSLSDQLLAWYDRHGRQLPWRVPQPDPYAIWLSEIMAQQTQLATVGPYFMDFMNRWPTLEALAGASLDEVLHAWQGLGHYARARNLHKCACHLTNELEGQFPRDEKALRSLPGIGPYTAAAIAAIAFGQVATPVDGNVERVMARFHGVTQALPKSKPKLATLARRITPVRRPGDHAQALMDLGATVCTPKKPACGRCSWRKDCRALALGKVEELPRRTPKKPKPTRQGVVFWAVGPTGEILLRRRPEKGLLGGMMEFPSTDWRTSPWSKAQALRSAPFAADWQALPGVVRHVFTHFKLELTVYCAPCLDPAQSKGIWCPVERLDEHALPSLMKKVASHVLEIRRSN